MTLSESSKRIFGSGKRNLVALAVGLVVGGVFATVTIAQSTPGQDPEKVQTVKTYGKNISIPIDHVGHYDWFSKPDAITDSADVTFVAETRIEGEATVPELNILPEETEDGVVVHITFEVTAFTAPASLVILNAHADDDGSNQQ